MPRWIIDAQDRKGSLSIDLEKNETKKRPGSALPLETGLICESCENKTSKYDTYAARFFKKKNELYNCNAINIQNLSVLLFKFEPVKVRKFILWTILRFYYSKEYAEIFKKIPLKHVVYFKNYINFQKDINIDDLKYFSFIKYQPEILFKGYTFSSFPKIVKISNTRSIQFDIGPFRFFQSFGSHTSELASSLRDTKQAYLHSQNQETLVLPYDSDLTKLAKRIKTTKKLGSTKYLDSVKKSE